MKKLINISGIYGLLALISGVFFREFTKAYHYTEYTTIGVSHVHLMVLGALLFLVLSIFARDTNIMETGKFKKFMVTYNIGLPFMIVMFYVRGIFQVTGKALSPAMNGMISGLAGLSHLIVAIGLIFLFLALKQVASEDK